MENVRLVNDNIDNDALFWRGGTEHIVSRVILVVVDIVGLVGLMVLSWVLMVELSGVVAGFEKAEVKV